ncbi:MAG TPA: hypothetical protein DCX04_02985, partial [Halomonas sp.]|nr:hypothetical protein [Halomonas sp.]
VRGRRRAPLVHQREAAATPLCATGDTMTVSAAGWAVIGLLALGGLALLAWWGWHTLDPALLLLGSRLC